MNEWMTDLIQNNTMPLSCSVENDEIMKELGKVFDYQYTGVVNETIKIPTFPNDFNIGVIVGSSGSGKSTILKKCFGGEEKIEWDNNKAIASHFSSVQQASSLFGAVGLNSIPTWCKPYNVLSTGEKFRADMARRLKSGAVIDEFTSVVNRDVAISCSLSLSKFIKNNGLHNIVFASCHDDIIPYLEPDWVYSTDERQFYTGRYLRQPIVLETHSCDSSLWSMFKKYHYLSGEINNAARCFVGMINKRPVAFCAVLSLPGQIKHAFKEHRLVVHPDFQGMGIGNKFSEMIAQAYVDKGCRYFCKTANPRMGEHRNRSRLWRPTIHNMKDRQDYIKKDGLARRANCYTMSADSLSVHAQRVCYAHEYIGDGERSEYTLEVKDDGVIEGQISVFEFL